MSLDLTKMSAEEITKFITDLAAGGLSMFGLPELGALAVAIGTLAQAVETALSSPNPQTILGTEVQAADVAADEAENLKFPTP